MLVRLIAVTVFPALSLFSSFSLAIDGRANMSLQLGEEDFLTYEQGRDGYYYYDMQTEDGQSLAVTFDSTADELSFVQKSADSSQGYRSYWSVTINCLGLSAKEKHELLMNLQAVQFDEDKGTATIEIPEEVEWICPLVS